MGLPKASSPATGWGFSKGEPNQPPFPERSGMLFSKPEVEPPVSVVKTTGEGSGGRGMSKRKGKGGRKC